MNRQRASAEDGAILILVAISLAALMALAAFAVDLGVFWTARGQAQNAADAGALAAATSLAVEDRTWPAPAGGAVEIAGTAVAQMNLINGASGVARVSASSCPPYLAAPYDTNCVQVDVYRDGQFSSGTLPTYFANIFSVTSQGVKATATAQVSVADASACARPWFMIDKYTDQNGNDQYDVGTDSYSAPGYTLSDVGTSVQFRNDRSPSGYGDLDVGAGANSNRDAIEHCVSGNAVFKIGDLIPTQPGAQRGPERQGLDTILGEDPDYNAISNPGGVHYDTTTKTVVGGCAAAGTCSCTGGCPYGGRMSPRIVQAALCSPAEAACALGGPNNSSITVTNIMSFFIVGYTGSGSELTINAIIIASAGELVPGGGALPGPNAAFLTINRLVR